MFGALFKKLK